MIAPNVPSRKPKNPKAAVTRNKENNVAITIQKLVTQIPATASFAERLSEKCLFMALSLNDVVESV